MTAGSLGRQLRRTVSRRAANDIYLANDPIGPRVVTLEARTAALNQAFITLQAQLSETFAGLGKTVNEIINSHNSTTHLAASIKVALEARGIPVTPVPLGPIPGVPGQTASGIALPAGVTYAPREDSTTPGDARPGETDAGDPTIASGAGVGGEGAVEVAAALTPAEAGRS